MILKKVLTVSPPRLMDASAMEGSIFFRFEILDRIPRVKLHLWIFSKDTDDGSGFTAFARPGSPS